MEQILKVIQEMKKEKKKGFEHSEKKSIKYKMNGK